MHAYVCVCGCVFMCVFKYVRMWICACVCIYISTHMQDSHSHKIQNKQHAHPPYLENGIRLWR